jgi:hypothetical protein
MWFLFSGASDFLHFTRLFASDAGSDGKMDPGSADSIFGFFLGY